VCGGGGGGEGWRGRRPWCSELSMRGECMLWGVYGGGGEGWRWRGGVEGGGDSCAVSSNLIFL